VFQVSSSSAAARSWAASCRAWAAVIGVVPLVSMSSPVSAVSGLPSLCRAWTVSTVMGLRPGMVRWVISRPLVLGSVRRVIGGRGPYPNPYPNQPEIRLISAGVYRYAQVLKAVAAQSE